MAPTAALIALPRARAAAGLRGAAKVKFTLSGVKIEKIKTFMMFI